MFGVYPYGSHVYQTQSTISDYDFIVVSSSHGIEEFNLTFDHNKLNVHLYPIEEFQRQITQHKISALECFFLPKHLKIKDAYNFDFNLNKGLLRNSISEKASHSWVKSKKKFEVEIDRNVYLAKKSLFHALRIIDFGTQISQYGKIIDYSSSNLIWFEIKNDPNEQWLYYKNKYQILFNNKMTEFRKITPLNK